MFGDLALSANLSFIFFEIVLSCVTIKTKPLMA